jgi:hypothetical protein
VSLLRVPDVTKQLNGELEDPAGDRKEKIFATALSQHLHIATGLLRQISGRLSLRTMQSFHLH